MRSTVLAIALATIAAPVFAGNARSEETMAAFNRNRARIYYSNQQWARQIQGLAADQRLARQDPDLAQHMGSPTAWMQERSHRSWGNWQQKTAPRRSINFGQ